MERMIPALFLLFLIYFVPPTHPLDNPTSIVFTTYARANYALDIFTIPVSPVPSFSFDKRQEFQATDGRSVNYNGFFYGDSLLYVSERSGSPDIYLTGHPTSPQSRRSALEADSRAFPVLPSPENGASYMRDRPSVSGDRLIYVSTQTPAKVVRQSWAAVYTTHLGTLQTRRLTPESVADFSPAVSPSGELTAVASMADLGWNGGDKEIDTDIYVFNTTDGSGRFKLVENGGWPSFYDDSTVYFHRKAEDGWWSIFRAAVGRKEGLQAERVTPPGIHAFTPAASRTGKFIVIATRRKDSDYRHIEIFDLVNQEFIQLTNRISPQKDHYNPFLSPDSTRVGYHKCRGPSPSRGSGNPLLLESIRSPIPWVSIFRIDGTFPSFSPDSDRIAYIPNLQEQRDLREPSRSSNRLTPDGPGVFVVNRDGTGKRRISERFSFGTVWDPIRRNVVYTSAGHAFGTIDTSVDIISISFSDLDMDPKNSHLVRLATKGNNAFPYPSPDGRYTVFRSSRSGYKNLYIMDALKGEAGYLHRLTEGNWSDTMCVWSNDGQWIAFSSDRGNPGSDEFELYLIHPNGTGLRRLFPNRIPGNASHPWFSPDSTSLVFAADYASVSSEPVSNPQQNMVHGEVFTVRLDGSDLKRITHNFCEDGSATWGSGYLEPVDVVYRDPLEKFSLCDFDDLLWLEHMANSQNDGKFATSHRLECGSLHRQGNESMVKAA